LSSSSDQGREDPSYSISDLKEEIISLKSELRDQTKANKLLEMERDSLVTALRLLQEDQLKATPRVKGQINAGTTSPPTENIPWIEVSSNPKKNKEKKSSPTETAAARNKSQDNPPELKPKKSVIILGDSMTKNLQGWKMLKAARVVSKCFPGSSVDDMCHYAIPTIKKKPDKVILHVGTNNIPEADSARHIAEKIVDLATFIEKESPRTKVTISTLITRKDSEAFKPKIEETNKILKGFATQRSWNFIDHKILMIHALTMVVYT